MHTQPYPPAQLLHKRRREIMHFNMCCMNRLRSGVEEGVTSFIIGIEDDRMHRMITSSRAPYSYKRTSRRTSVINMSIGSPISCTCRFITYLSYIMFISQMQLFCDMSTVSK